MSTGMKSALGSMLEAGKEALRERKAKSAKTEKPNTGLTPENQKLLSFMIVGS